MSRALIFDCDGVLGDTERHGHLPAFNRMWREFGVPWQWSPEQYAEKLKISGGKERLAALLEESRFLEVFNPPRDPRARGDLLAAWHRRKSAIFQEIVNSGRIPPRPGVKRLAEEALERGWKLAVASTSAQSSVEAMLLRAVGAEMKARFSAILAGDVVGAKKPAPDIYLLAADRLGVPAGRCLALEDSSNGLRAALSAGMKCVVTVTDWTRGEDFSGAAVVLTGLGEPGGEPARVVANGSNAFSRAWFSVDELENLLAPASGDRLGATLHPVPG